MPTNVLLGLSRRCLKNILRRRLAAEPRFLFKGRKVAYGSYRPTMVLTGRWWSWRRHMRRYKALHPNCLLLLIEKQLTTWTKAPPKACFEGSNRIDGSRVQPLGLVVSPRASPGTVTRPLHCLSSVHNQMQPGK